MPQRGEGKMVAQRKAEVRAELWLAGTELLLGVVLG